MEKIFNARTFEEAKEMAAAEFKMDELDIHFEIIEQPVKKLFGIKGEFRVKAWCETVNGESVVPTVNNTQSREIKKEFAPVKANTKAEVLSGAEADKYKYVVSYLENILKQLGADGFAINVKSAGHGETVILDITGENLGIIIGRRGETLDSLQYLAILANNRGVNDENKDNHARITVDCNGYREKRAETLELLATRTSSKVIKQGRRITLEPMNPYERRIIHSKVAEIDGVYSNSVGDEPYRKVVISAEIPKRRGAGERPSERGNFDGRRGGDRNRGGGNVSGRSYKQSNGFSTSFERDYKKTPSSAPEISQDTVDVEKNASLYGKIEL